MKDVLVFRYLPILWYRYPIPNEIREYWYNERPDILKYMQKAYQNLDIQFLPDSLIQELINKNYEGHQLFPSINSMNEHFHNFWITHLDKLF
jgi:tagatose-1,6-bisphosphate aldolase non-catalytic subunit AgaZ/GatZ